MAAEYPQTGDTSLELFQKIANNTAEIAAKPTSGDMLRSSYDSDADGKVNAAAAADSVPWSGVSGKPSTFSPSAHTHSPSDVNLSNVNNTSDANKPVSTAQQAALNLKEDAGNKEIIITPSSNTKFPTSKAVADYVAAHASTGGGGVGNGDSTRQTIPQTAHGFVPGSVIYNNNGTWQKAQANSIGTCRGVAIVESAPTADSFVAVTSGKINASAMNLLATTTYYLDSVIAGGLVATAPVAPGTYVVAVLRTGTSTDAIVSPAEPLSNAYIAPTDIDRSTDGTLASNSDNKIPTEKAVKTYVDSAVASAPGGAGVVAGTAVLWRTADIANVPATYIVCDGDNGTTDEAAVGGMTVCLVGNGTVATPTLSLTAGTYTGTQTPTVTCTTSGATIKYTTDGGTPSRTNGTEIASGETISVDADATIKIIAYKDLWKDSAVASVAFVITAPQSGPTLVYSDTFNYADSQYLEGAAPNDWEALTSDRVWTWNSGGDTSVYASGSAASRAKHAVNANQRAEITVTAMPSGTGAFLDIICRAAAAPDRTYYQFSYGGDGYSVGRWISGAYSSIVGTTAAPMTLVAGDKLALEVSGTGSATRLKIQYYHNATWTTISENIDPGATYLDSGYAGIGAEWAGSSARIDMVAIYNL